jgi:hypothetical protein
MQGERDAREKLSAAYTHAMKQLVTNLRRDLDKKDRQCSGPWSDQRAMA